MTRIPLIFGMGVVGLQSLSLGTVSEEKAAGIGAIFCKHSFAPHFPTEHQLLQQIGSGTLAHVENSEYRVYRHAKTNLWIGCRIDEENRVERPITGILVSEIPLVPQRSVPSVRFSFPCSSLHSVRIGDSVADALAKCGRPPRTYNTRFIKEANLLVYEYFPKSLEVGSCIRFFALRNRVVAISFSSEE